MCRDVHKCKRDSFLPGDRSWNVDLASAGSKVTEHVGIPIKVVGKVGAVVLVLIRSNSKNTRVPADTGTCNRTVPLIKVPTGSVMPATKGTESTVPKSLL